MILVDTSIWIDHFRTGDPKLVGLLQDGHVLAHPCLFGRGLGYVDAHLLAATLLTPDARLWTRDKRLATTAVRHALASHNDLDI